MTDFKKRKKERRKKRKKERMEHSPLLLEGDYFGLEVDGIVRGWFPFEHRVTPPCCVGLQNNNNNTNQQHKYLVE